MREINIKIIIFIWIEFKNSFDFIEFIKIDENNENDKIWILFDFEFVNIEFIFEIIPNEISSSQISSPSFKIFEFNSKILDSLSFSSSKHEIISFVDEIWIN